MCGEPLQSSAERCEDCRERPPAYTAMRNLGVYEGVIRDCVHALKYENNQGLGEFFTDLLGALVREAGWLPDLVMPVPLSAQRAALRGYNQAGCIAQPLAAHLETIYHPFGLVRTRDTPSQVGLSGEARHRNVAGAFYAVPDVVAGKRVLVVDDVMTTGATMKACADALRGAGAKEIYCLTLGRFSARNSSQHDVRHQV